jgi:hypothetical protein
MGFRNPMSVADTGGFGQRRGKQTVDPEKTEYSQLEPLKVEFIPMDPGPKAPQRFIPIEEIGRIADRVTISPRARAMSLKSATRPMSDHPWEILSYEIRRPNRPAVGNGDPPTPTE